MIDASEEAEIRFLARSLLSQPGRPLYDRALARRRSTSNIKKSKSRWTKTQAHKFGRPGRPPRRVPSVDDTIQVGSVVHMRSAIRRVAAIRYGAYGLASDFLLSPLRPGSDYVWTPRYAIIKGLRPIAQAAD